MTIDDIFTLYLKKYVPACANLVALEVYRPEQILIEESNILSHLSQYKNPNFTPEIKEENLSKAKNHLLRSILDTNKLVWISLKDKIDLFMKNPRKRLVFTLPDDDILKIYRDFDIMGVEARKFETRNIGNDPLKSVERYEEVINKGFELYKNIDVNKAITVKKWSFLFETTNIIIAFIISLVASFIAGHYLNCKIFF